MTMHVSPDPADRTGPPSLPASAAGRPAALNQSGSDALKHKSPVDRDDLTSRRISCKIGRRLRATGYHALQTIDHEYCGGTVILRGRVPTYYMKQLAQSLLLADPLVVAIVNLIEVSEAAVANDGRRSLRRQGKDRSNVRSTAVSTRSEPGEK